MNSLINQTYYNLQIILVDDGSVDKSGEICDSYAMTDSRIQVIHQENMGVSKARNVGLDIVQGEFVAFIDSDDWVHNKYFEIMMMCQEKSAADVVMVRSTRTGKFVDDKIIIADCVEYSPMTIYEILSDEVAKTRIWGRCYRASLIEKVRFLENIHLGEDTCFNLKSIISCKKCSCIMIEQSMYYYFVRDDSLVHTADYNNLFEVAQWYIKQMEMEIDDLQVKGVWSIEACKVFLAYRYLSMFNMEEEKRQQCNKILKKCIVVMKDSKSTGRLYYDIMCRCPLLYRVYRICTDRTMIAWEREQKKRFKK